MHSGGEGGRRRYPGVTALRRKPVTRSPYPQRVLFAAPAMVRSSRKPGFARFALAAAGVIALEVSAGCRGPEPSTRGSRSLVAEGGIAADAVCTGDSLRPSAAAPAQGLWVYRRPNSSEQVAAMIGATQSVDGVLAVTRPVETVEIDADGDTVRTKAEAASVTLELLPVYGAALGGGVVDRTPSQPAATYVLSPQVGLAAYEPCAMSNQGPRVRYLRRDQVGRVVTDVLLSRASER